METDSQGIVNQKFLGASQKLRTLLREKKKKEVERNSQIDPTEKASVQEQTLPLFLLSSQRGRRSLRLTRSEGTTCGSECWTPGSVATNGGPPVEMEVAEKHLTPFSLPLF